MTTNLDVADSLLQLMRDPESVIERVSETCYLGQTVTKRKLQLTLTPGSMAVKDGFAYIDILHVPKGALIDLEVHTPNVERVSHGEHLAVSELMIRYRLYSLWGTTAGLTGAALDQFDDEMHAVELDMVTVPYISSQRADELIRKHFDLDAGILHCVLRHPGLTVSAAQMHQLFRLLRRLASRYLVLLRAPVNTLTVSDVEFSYNYEVTGHRFGRKDKKPRWGSVKYARRPSSFRVHVPWAKRTRHYTIQIATPQDYFVARQAILVWRDDGVEELGSDDPLPVKWSLDASGGRSLTAFLSDSSKVGPSLYVGVQFVDVPGGATSKATELAWVAFAVMFSFLVLVGLGEGPAFEAGALILAIAAVGAFASTPAVGGGALGTPLIARRVPKYVAYLISLFVLWFASRAMVLSEWSQEVLGSQLLDVLHPAWMWWELLGGPAILLSCFVVACVVSHRRRTGTRLYAEALKDKTLFSANLYGS